MRFALWQLMWAVIGFLILAPVIVFSEAAAGNPGDLVNVILGACCVFAGWFAGAVILEQFDWPGWLRG